MGIARIPDEADGLEAGSALIRKYVLHVILASGLDPDVELLVHLMGSGDIAMTVFFLERDQTLEHLFPLGIARIPDEADVAESRYVQRGEFVSFSIFALPHTPMSQLLIRVLARLGNVAVTVFFLERDQALEHLFPVSLVRAPHETDGLELLCASRKKILAPEFHPCLHYPIAELWVLHIPERNVAVTMLFLERDQALE